MKLLILIPSFNEAVTIEEVVTVSLKTGYDVLVVDDGSSDATSRLAVAAGAKVVRHPVNLGVVAALQTGYTYALEHGYEAMIQLDGDGQHTPADIGKMLAPIADNSADFVIGSRFLGVGAYKMPFARRVGRAILRGMLGVFGICITDPTSGLRAVRREVAELFVSPEFPEDYPDADAILLASRAGFRIVEIGVTMRQSRTGKTFHSGVLHPFKYMLCMILSFAAVAMRRKTRKSP